MPDLKVDGIVSGIEGGLTVNVQAQDARPTEGARVFIGACSVRARLSRRLRDEGLTLTVGDRVGLLIAPVQPQPHEAVIIHSCDEPSPRATHGAQR